jgi:holin-like protein
MPRSLRTLAVVARRRLRQSWPLQIAVLAAFWLLGLLLTAALALPIPGAIVGLFLLLAALLAGGIRLADLRRGARWFLAELLLFFVPTVLHILDHDHLFGWTGLKILAAIVIGTLVVMTATALSVEATLRLIDRPANR